MTKVENEILFSEKQKFRQWWLWVILLGVNALFIYGIFKQIVDGRQFGSKPISNVGLIITAGLTLLLSLLFLTIRLETQIRKNGIHVRFFPFQIAFKHYEWSSLKKSYVRQYSAIFEYGGWGFRYGLFGNGLAFNVSGNQGLQLEFLSKRKLLIGTNKPEEIRDVLNKIGQFRQ